MAKKSEDKKKADKSKSSLAQAIMQDSNAYDLWMWSVAVRKENPNYEG